MRKKLLKGFAVMWLFGLGWASLIAVRTYPNIPKGSFFNIANWTRAEWVFSVPITITALSSLALLILFLIPIFQSPKCNGAEGGSK